MPKLPAKIILNLDTERVYIDGEEFPWYIAENSVDVNGLMSNTALPELTVSILADTIEIIPKRPTRQLRCMILDGADPLEQFAETFPGEEIVGNEKVFQKPDGTRWVRCNVVDTTETTTN